MRVPRAGGLNVRGGGNDGAKAMLPKLQLQLQLQPPAPSTNTPNHKTTPTNRTPPPTNTNDLHYTDPLLATHTTTTNHPQPTTAQSIAGRPCRMQYREQRTTTNNLTN